MCVWGLALIRIPRDRLGFAYILGRLVSLVREVLRVAVPDTTSSFIWSIANITLARLILNLRRLSSDAGDNNAEFQDEGEVEDEGEGGVELPVLHRERHWGGRRDSEPHKIL